MRQSAMKYSVGLFIILTLIYFIVGFLTTVNGQFQSAKYSLSLRGR